MFADLLPIRRLSRPAYFTSPMHHTLLPSFSPFDAFDTHFRVASPFDTFYEPFTMPVVRRAPIRFVTLTTAPQAPETTDKKEEATIEKKEEAITEKKEEVEATVEKKEVESKLEEATESKTEEKQSESSTLADNSFNSPFNLFRPFSSLNTFSVQADDATVNVTGKLPSIYEKEHVSFTIDEEKRSISIKAKKEDKHCLSSFTSSLPIPQFEGKLDSTNASLSLEDGVVTITIPTINETKEESKEEKKETEEITEVKTEDVKEQKKELEETTEVKTEDVKEEKKEETKEEKVEEKETEQVKEEKKEIEQEVAEQPTKQVEEDVKQQPTINIPIHIERHPVPVEAQESKPATRKRRKSL